MQEVPFDLGGLNRLDEKTESPILAANKSRRGPLFFHRPVAASARPVNALRCGVHVDAQSDGARMKTPCGEIVPKGSDEASRFFSTSRIGWLSSAAASSLQGVHSGTSKRGCCFRPSDEQSVRSLKTRATTGSMSRPLLLNQGFLLGRETREESRRIANKGLNPPSPVRHAFLQPP